MARDADDPHDLQRFVDAQEAVYERVRAELSEGQKRSHWMWFIFPQAEGLGSSPMARRYAIRSREEAAAYLRHPVLGPRLRECTQLVTRVAGRSIDAIFGTPDNMKFHSSMTLFAHATAANEDFIEALRKYFAGAFDPATLDWLQ